MSLTCINCPHSFDCSNYAVIEVCHTNKNVLLILFKAINYCESSPCLNGATCEQRVNVYSFNCPSGYTGDSCQYSKHDFIIRSGTRSSDSLSQLKMKRLVQMYVLMRTGRFM